MRPTHRVLPVACLTVFLCAPGAAWLLGARQPTLEQRPKAAFPDINRSSLPNPATFERLEAAVLDRLPLRRYALEARGRAAVELFKDSPNAEVLLGASGALFYIKELRACTEPDGIPGPDPADGAEILARTLVESGRRTTVVVVGSKIIAQRERLREPRTDELDCVAAIERSLRERLGETPGGLDLEPQFAAARRERGPVFLKYDTHWNGDGQLIFARAVLEAVRPGLSDEVGLTSGQAIRWRGDLGVLSGLRLTETLRPAVARRPPSKPFASGEVLLIGDSQMERAILEDRPDGSASVQSVALPTAATCTWMDYDDGRCDQQLERADTVVMERVARNAREIGIGCWRGVSVAGAQLRGRAAPWVREDDSRVRGPLAVDGSATVRFAPPSGNVRDTPRLMRIPITALPAPAPSGEAPAISVVQQPRAGGEVPCVTPTQDTVGDAIFVPIPAGRPATDIQIVLQAPAGTVVGPPEEIILDGKPE